MKQRKFQEAADFAEGEYLKGPEANVFWLTQQARALVRASEHRSALEVSRQALDLDPTNHYAVAATADALSGLKRYDEALQHYGELLHNPRLLRAGRKGILECLAGTKRWKELLQSLGGWDLPEEEALPWRVKALSGLERSEEALEDCNRWLELKPHHPPALWERTELEVRRNGLEAALEKAGKMARIPSLPQVYREIYASLCRRAGRTEEAMQTYEKIGAQGTQTRILKKQAFTLAKDGREQEAIPLLEELLKLEPKDMYLYSSYSAACIRIGEVERAINFYNQLLGLFPGERSLYGRINRLRKKLEGGS